MQSPVAMKTLRLALFVSALLVAFAGMTGCCSSEAVSVFADGQVLSKDEVTSHYVYVGTKGDTVELSVSFGAFGLGHIDTISWSGDGVSSGDLTLELTLEHDMRVNVNFEDSEADACGEAIIDITVQDVEPVPDANLIVSIVGPGGRVTSDPEGINCASGDALSSVGCYTDFEGSMTLLATASEGYHFVGWSGSCSGTGAAITVQSPLDGTCVATFEMDGPVSCDGLPTPPVPALQLYGINGNGMATPLLDANGDGVYELPSFMLQLGLDGSASQPAGMGYLDFEFTLALVDGTPTSLPNAGPSSSVLRGNLIEQYGIGQEIVATLRVVYAGPYAQCTPNEATTSVHFILQ